MGFTAPVRGPDPALDSNPDGDGQTDIFTINPLDDDLTIDAGLVSLPYGSIGDHVWDDINANGIQDMGELSSVG
jgi:hypothetical protein